MPRTRTKYTDMAYIRDVMMGYVPADANFDRAWDIVEKHNIDLNDDFLSASDEQIRKCADGLRWLRNPVIA